MDQESLIFYREAIAKRDVALREAHDALRSNASDREKNNAKAAIADVLPDLQQ